MTTDQSLLVVFSLISFKKKKISPPPLTPTFHTHRPTYSVRSSSLTCFLHHGDKFSRRQQSWRLTTCRRNSADVESRARGCAPVWQQQVRSLERCNRVAERGPPLNEELCGGGRVKAASVAGPASATAAAPPGDGGDLHRTAPCLPVPGVGVSLCLKSWRCESMECCPHHQSDSAPPSPLITVHPVGR